MNLPLYFWPIFTALWMCSAFLISYFVALIKQHILPFFPYISDTGTFPPESCIFGQMLNMGAVLLLFTMYIRYRTVETLSHRGYSKSYLMWNKFSVILGIISCLGISLVANFQETSEINVHGAGAFCAFVVGGVYCVIQAYLTYLSYLSNVLKCVRILLSFLIIPLYLISTVCTAISFDEFNVSVRNQFKWSEKDPGFVLHVIATSTEWMMAVVMLLYIATFYVEFRLVKLKKICLVLED